MSRVVANGLSISLDGYLAGPDPSLDAPLGRGGEQLHAWALATRSMCDLHGLPGGEEGPDDAWAGLAVADVGATVMGRGMFGPPGDPREHPDWRGWWGDDPPFHHPLFVLTHHAREPLAMDGGTTVHFVTGGLDEALERARDAAGEADVRVGGGASVIRQALTAGRLDELHVAVVPLLLGAGTRLFEDGLADLPGRYEVRRWEATGTVLHALITRRD